MRPRSAVSLLLASLLATACTASETAPSRVTAPGLARNSASPGPETPYFNLEVQLRGDAGFGLVKFRQPKDADRIAYLDVWVRDLAPNHSYQLQRAVDTNLDGVCTSVSWLTLGKGTVPQAIMTDDKGTDREALFRDLGAFAPGTTFDIHFRIVDASTGAPVLTSDCYQFTVTQ